MDEKFVMKKTIRKQQKHNLTTEKPNCDHQGSDRARQSGDRILSILHEHLRHRFPIQGAVHLEELHMKKLPEEAGIHRTYLGGIELGLRNPSLRKIARIAHVAPDRVH